MNNIVPSNYSADNVPNPVFYNIGFIQNTISGEPPVDDYNRTFPGNVLNATHQLFTQCWNQTDSQVWLLRILVAAHSLAAQCLSFTHGLQHQFFAFCAHASPPNHLMQTCRSGHCLFIKYLSLALPALVQGLLSPSWSIIVQVVDTCKCQKVSPEDACCTNLPHFNLGYQAFQKLAHPDYGLMSLMFRSAQSLTKLDRLCVSRSDQN